jgi:purine-binding chemotaxis protein CheW
MGEALSPSAQRAAAIMDERALALARPPMPPEVRSDQRDALIFRVGSERYAIETCCVREIARMTHIVRLPSGAELFLGVTNLGGEILPVVDLDKLLACSANRPVERPWLIVLGEDRAEFAIAVEAVEQVKAVSFGRSAGTVRESERHRSQLVRGLDTDALMLLEGTAMLNDPRLSVRSAQRNHAGDHSQGQVTQ